MADRTTTSQGAGNAPTATGPDEIRNVVLVGPSGGGKTTLVEALLVAAGVLTRSGSVADGNTVCDYDDAEIRQQRSVGVAVASLSHDGVKVNLVDTPGYADFVGELRAGLRAADCALFVIAANEGVDEPTKSLWQECNQVGMPRAVVITKLDHTRANYAEALAAAQNAFGDKVLPLYLPTDLPNCSGLIGLLSQQRYEYTDGTRAVRSPNPSDAEQIEEARGALIEGIIEESEDESLMERYLGGEAIDESVLIADLERAVARGLVLSGDPGLQQQRRRHPGIAGGRHPRLPLPAGTPTAGGLHAGRCAARHPDVRRGRPAARGGGEDDVGPVRGQGQPGPGVLRHHQARHDGPCVGPFCVVLRQCPRGTRY